MNFNTKEILEKLDNDKLVKISQIVKLNVNGFRKIEYKNGILNPPRNFIIKSLMDDKYRKKIIDILENEKSYLTVSSNEDINTKDKYKEDYSNERDRLLNEIDSLKNNIILLRNKLEENNYKFHMDIKNIKKEKVKLEEENKRLKKQSEKLNSSNEKYIYQFYNLKRKYDELKNIYAKEQKNIDEKSTNVEELKLINKKLNEEINSLKLIKIKKIGIFGNINSTEINIDSIYDFKMLQVDKLDDLQEDIKDFDEIWMLSYNIAYLDKIKIERNIDRKKIKEFRSYKSLKNYLEKGN